MGLFSRAEPEPDASWKPRRDVRYRNAHLTAPECRIVEVSSSGLRVEMGRRLTAGEQITLTIQTGAASLSATARVVWARRRGLRGCVAGLEFVGLESAPAEALVDFARFGNQVRNKPRPDPSPLAAVQIDDLYAILGVPRGATEEQIQSSYRRLARAWHPDVCKLPEALERFATLTKAYGVLRDPDKRRRYDDLVRKLAA